MLLTTGNGSSLSDPTVQPGLRSTPQTNLGEAIVRLKVQRNRSLRATDFFSPSNAQSWLDPQDLDLGSGGVAALPSRYFGTGSIPHLAVIAGKEGFVYLLNRDDLGGHATGPGGSDRVVGRAGADTAASPGAGYGGVWGTPAVWPGDGGYIWLPTATAKDACCSPEGFGALNVYSYGRGAGGQPLLSLAGSSDGAASGFGTGSELFGFGSSSAAVSSNGTRSGSALAWVTWSPPTSDETRYGIGAQLRAYDAVPRDGRPVLLWSAPIGRAARFNPPLIDRGRVYVGTGDGRVIGFGPAL
jgi:iron transport multicopper oxidase